MQSWCGRNFTKTLGKGRRQNALFWKQEGQKCRRWGQKHKVNQVAMDEICCEEGSPALHSGLLRASRAQVLSRAESSRQHLPLGPWHLPSAQVWPMGQMNRRQPLLPRAASRQCFRSNPSDLAGQTYLGTEGFGRRPLGCSSCLRL